MAKRVFQCEGCTNVFSTEDEANKCHAQHSLEGLADLMHGRLCRLDHTEQCDYLYDNWDKTGARRQYWLQKAIELNRFSNQCNVAPQTLVTFIAAMCG